MWKIIIDGLVWVTEGIISLATGELLLKGRANGGTVIVMRAALTSSIVFVVVLAVRALLKAETTWDFDFAALRADVLEILPWFGAIFAGVYAGLYARFANQWTYLADLYNQIMAAQVQCPVIPKNRDAYTKWFVGFIVDAEALHLALKPTFASVIEGFLEKPGVAEGYADGGADCPRQLEGLRKEVRRVLERVNGLPVRETPHVTPAAGQDSV